MITISKIYSLPISNSIIFLLDPFPPTCIDPTRNTIRTFPRYFLNIATATGRKKEGYSWMVNRFQYREQAGGGFRKIEKSLEAARTRKSMSRLEETRTWDEREMARCGSESEPILLLPSDHGKSQEGSSPSRLSHPCDGTPSSTKRLRFTSCASCLGMERTVSSIMRVFMIMRVERNFFNIVWIWNCF